MTKYSPENKYQERQTAALEKIADQLATIIAKLIKDEEREKQSQIGSCGTGQLVDADLLVRTPNRAVFMYLVFIQMPMRE